MPINLALVLLVIVNVHQIVAQRFDGRLNKAVLESWVIRF